MKKASCYANFSPGGIMATKLVEKTVTAFLKYVEGSHMQLECFCNLSLHSIILLQL